MNTKIILLLVVLFGFLAVVVVGCQKDDESSLSSEMETSHLAKIHPDDLIVDLDQVDESIKQDAIDYYGRVITIADFPQDKILDQSYEDKIHKSISKSDVGGTPENALTYLIFDENGILFTAKRYNQDDEILGRKAFELYQQGESLNEANMYQFVDRQIHYKTDLKTFYEVTALKEATSEYADAISNIWIFDPYVKFFEKREDKKAIKN